ATESIDRVISRGGDQGLRRSRRRGTDDHREPGGTPPTVAGDDQIRWPTTRQQARARVPGGEPGAALAPGRQSDDPCPRRPRRPRRRAIHPPPPAERSTSTPSPRRRPGGGRTATVLAATGGVTPSFGTRRARPRADHRPCAHARTAHTGTADADAVDRPPS